MREQRSDAPIESDSGRLRQVFVDRARPGDGMCQFAHRSPGPPCSAGHAGRSRCRSADEPASTEGQSAGRRRTRRCSRPLPRNPVKELRRRNERRSIGFRYHQHSKGLPVARIPTGRPTPKWSLPNDSDQATLDAIAATGKPLTLAEAVDTGLPLSTSVACPARDHRSSPRAAADRVFDVPADRGRELRRG